MAELSDTWNFDDRGEARLRLGLDPGDSAGRPHQGDRGRRRRRQRRQPHGGRGLDGVEFIVANTDLQALRTNKARASSCRSGAS